MANKKNKVKFGLKNCHYAIATLAEDGTVSFGTPVAMPGAVSLSLDAEGENDPFYADDSVYYMVSNNNGYSGDFELALIPESFLTDVMHETEDANGVIAEKAPESGCPGYSGGLARPVQYLLDLRDSTSDH